MELTIILYAVGAGVFYLGYVLVSKVGNKGLEK